jgi:hypothetical protein
MMMFSMTKVILPLIHRSPKPYSYRRNADGHDKVIHYNDGCPN